MSDKPGAHISMSSVYTSLAFKKLMEASKDRLAHGARLRSTMQREIEAGRVPIGYRADLLNEVSQGIIALLCEAAERFNRDHEHDLLSTADMLDCLATSRKKLLDGVQAFRQSVQDTGGTDG